MILITKIFYFICFLTVLISGHGNIQRSHILHQVKSVSSSGPHKDVCKEAAVCVPHVQCPAHIRQDTKNFCTTKIGRKGVCCSTGGNHTCNVNLIFKTWVLTYLF